MVITLPEMLHVAGVGILKNMFSCLSDIIGLSGTKEREKEQRAVGQFASTIIIPINTSKRERFSKDYNA